MLDGAARVKDLVQAVAADGQPAVAITDHGVLYGVVDFYRGRHRRRASSRSSGSRPTSPPGLVSTVRRAATTFAIT